MPQVIGVPTEIAAGGKLVATGPDVVEKLIKLGCQVPVPAAAAEAATLKDEV